MRLAARRSAFEVGMDILRVISEGRVRPTHIMYRSNTSWIVLQKNLESFQSSGFVRLADEPTRAEYCITEKGMKVVRDYTELVARAAAVPEEVRY
jgi:predicted transcriptional regulator